jgi:heat shock protein 4
LIGRTLQDPEVEEYEKKFINAQLVDVNGTIGVKVSSSANVADNRSTTLANPTNSPSPSWSLLTLDD